MITKTYYCKNNNTTNTIINYVKDNYICFVKEETIEMNYLEITIKCRIEDKHNIDLIMNVIKEE